MATISVKSVNRAWQQEECGPLVQFIGTKRSGMSMEFIVERSVAKQAFNDLYMILYHEPCLIKLPDYADEPTHYVVFSGYAHFVKEAGFFVEQGGLTAEWGKRWRPVVADSIEEARDLSTKMEWDDRPGFIRDTDGNYGAIVP